MSRQHSALLLAASLLSGALEARSAAFVETFDDAARIQTSTGLDISGHVGHPIGAPAGFIPADSPGLVFLHRFDAPRTGADFLDSSPNFSSATCAGCVQTPGDHLSGSASFAMNDRLYIPTSTGIQSINATRAFTFSTWVKMPETVAGTLLRHSANGNWASSNLQFTVATSNGQLGPLYLYLRDAGGVFVLASGVGNFPINTWTHVACSYGPDSREMRVYINGVQPYQSPRINSDVIPNMTNLSLSVLDNMGGSLDETALWNRQLSNAEVSALSQIVTNYAQFTSTRIALSGSARSLRASWTEAQPRAISLEASFDDISWFSLGNGQFVDPFALGLSTNNYDRLRYRAVFNAGADVDDLTFDYLTDDSVPPAIGAIEISSRAYDATVRFQTDEFSTASVSVLIDGTWTPFAQGASSTTFAIDATGLTPGQSYQYRITATDAYGNSSSALGTLETVGSCLSIDVCGNSVDDDCNGTVDDPGICLPLNARAGPDALGVLIDSVAFGANHLDGRTIVAYALPLFTPRDNDFGQHNGVLNFNAWGTVDSFHLGSGESLEFDLHASSGYHILSIDSTDNVASYGLQYSYDGGATSTNIVVGAGAKYFNGYLLDLPLSGNVHVRVTGGNYVGGARLSAVRPRLPRVLPDAVMKPKLHFDDFEPILGRINTTPALAPYRSRLTAGWGSADSGYVAPLSHACNAGGGRGYAEALNLNALACLVDGGPAYCTAAVNTLLKFATWPQTGPAVGWGRFENTIDDGCGGGTTNILNIGEMLYGNAVAYDLVYDFMTPAQRAATLTAIDREANYLYQRSLLLGGWTNETWWHYAPSGNNWSAVANGLGMAGLVLQGFSPDADRFAGRGVELTKIYINRLSPNVRYEGDAPNSSRSDGVGNESYGYTSYPNKYSLGFFHAFRRKKGIDHFPYGGDKLRKSIDYYIYGVTPQGIGYATFDDYYSSPDEGGDPITDCSHVMNAAIFGNPVALWHWDYRSGSQKNVAWTYTTGGQVWALEYTLLFHPGGTLTPVDPGTAGYPLGRLFQYGRAVSRTSWTDRNAAYMHMTGGIYGSHSHDDQGSFFYGAAGNMLITERDGVSSSFHNVVQIDGLGPGHGGRGSWLEIAPVGFLHTGALDYMAADMNTAYDFNIAVSSAVRRVLFRRPGPGSYHYMVVADRFTPADGASHNYASLFHQEEQHTATSQVGVGHYRFAGSGAVLHNGNILNGRRADVDLDVLIASSFTSVNTGVPFRININAAASADYMVLFYPHMSTAVPAGISRINAGGVTGFSIGGDLVVHRQTPGAFNYVHNGSTLTSDGFLALVSTGGLRALMGGTFLNFQGLGVTASIPTNVVVSSAGSGFEISLGDESTSENAGPPTASITLSSVTPGYYQYSLDGVVQANINGTSGSLAFSAALSGRRNIVLTHMPGSAAPPAAAPSTAPVSAVSTSALTAHWVDAFNPAGTDYRSDLSTDAFSTLNASSRTANLFATFAALLPNTTYFLRVLAFNADGAPSAPTDLEATATLANPPAGGALSAVDSVSVALSWDANGNPPGTRYRVQSSTDAFAHVSVESLFSSTSATLGGLQPGTTYDFRVQAVGVGGAPTDFLALGSTTTAPFPTPRSVRATTATAASLSFAWVLDAPGSQAPLAALASDAAFASIISSGVLGLGAQTTSYAGLSPNTTYWFKVKVATVADLGYSGAITTWTWAAAPGEGSLGGASTGSLLAAWQAGGNPAGTLYRLEISSMGWPGSLLSTSSLSAFAGGLPANTIHQARVSAVDHGGRVTASVSLGARSTLARAPTDAALPFAALHRSSVTAAWTPRPAAPAEQSCAGYVLQASTDLAFSGIFASTSTASPSVGALTLSGLVPGVTFYYRVGSLNADGAANWLNLPSTFTTSPSAAGAITSASSDTVISVSSNGVILRVIVTASPSAFSSGAVLSADLAPPAVPLPGTVDGSIQLLGGFAIDAGGRQPLGNVRVQVLFDRLKLPPMDRGSVLGLGRYDASAGRWRILPTSADTATGWADSQTDHFSVFGLLIIGASSDLSDVKVFPIPWKPSSGDPRYDAPGLSLRRMPPGSRATILNLPGERVWGAEADQTGALSWDGRNASGQAAASGVYLIVVESGSKRIVKRAVLLR